MKNKSLISIHDYSKEDYFKVLEWAEIFQKNPKEYQNLLNGKVIATLFFAIPSYVLFLYLGFFAGFLLYIGVSDILPEAHSQKSSFKLIGLTILGVLIIFIITRLI